MDVDESFRSSDLGDEEEKEEQGRVQGVHDDRPAMDTTEGKESKGRKGRGSGEFRRLRRTRGPPATCCRSPPLWSVVNATASVGSSDGSSDSDLPDCAATPPLFARRK